MSSAHSVLPQTSATFQYVSDLHLEFRTYSDLQKIVANIVPFAPYLVLAGDVGKPSHPNYAFFLTAMSKAFEHVFLVAGNHEFYGSSLPEIYATLTKLCEPLSNVHFLNDQVYTDASLPVHIFGGTMWSLIKDEERRSVQLIMNDSRHIKGFSTDTISEQHVRFVERLGVALDAHSDKPFLVISHYLPSYALIDPLYRDSDVNSAFATDVPLAHDERIKAWIYGHTHKARPGPRFYCNPLGYPGENMNVVYNALLRVME
jgi:predicted phosphodiesterase